MIKDLDTDDEGSFEITEGNTKYKMRYKLFKSSLTVYDMEGNLISIDKRKGRIVINRHGRSKTVDWHRE
jgi:hypothetical protein